MILTKKTLTVAWWEFIERVKTKSFIIGLFLLPLIMAVFSAGPALLSDSLEESEALVIVVNDETGVVFDSLRAAYETAPTLANGTPKYDIRRHARMVHHAADPRASLDSLLLNGTVSATIYIPAGAIDSHSVEYRALNVSDIEGISGFEEKISDIITRHRMTRAGLDPDVISQLDRWTEMRTVRVTEKGEKETGFLESFGLSYVFIILTMIMVLTSGQMLVRSMVEEKSNRIVEVLVSSCSPMDLMFGKILGMGMLAFAPIIVWALMGVTLLLVADIGNLPLENLWLMLVYFVLGFLLYSSLFVAFGCLTSTEQEAQQMTGYLSMLIMLPIVIAFIASQSPNNPILVFLTMIPFLTPQMMFIRLPIMTPPSWEIALSLGILVLSIIAITWAAAKIFRVGILLTGKRPGLDEILRWLRS
jgi:ABC-2 type transport system permease protein